MNRLTTSAFDLPDRLAAKADPALIAGDERHFAAIAASLEQSIAGLSGRLGAERQAPGGAGQKALDRDMEIHRLTARLRALGRFGLDLCLGRVVSAGSPEPAYIGRLGLKDSTGGRLLADWRSPAAEPFFGATHASPMGLASRRRYRWTRGRISDYWDEVLPGLGEEGVQTCTLRDLVAEGAAATTETDPDVARPKSSAGLVKAVEAAVRFYEQPPAKGMTVGTAWSDIWPGTGDWAEAFEAPEPGTRTTRRAPKSWMRWSRSCWTSTTATSRLPCSARHCGRARSSARPSTARGRCSKPLTSSQTCGRYEVMAEAEPVIRAVLPDASAPVSIRSTGIPARCGFASDLGPILGAWLAARDGGTACVIGDPAFQATPRARSLTPELSKGLEFDLVILIDPQAFGEGIEGAVDRYVAMTRATRQLVILTSS